MKHLEERFCGQKVPKETISVHQKVEVVFKSDHTGKKHTGFLGNYTFIDESKLLIS